MTIFDTTDRWACRLWATYRTSPHLNRVITPSRAEREKGSVTMENVIWALAVIAIAAIVVAAITAYVNRESALLGS